MTTAFLTCTPQTHARLSRFRRQLWAAVFLCFAVQAAQAIHTTGKAAASSQPISQSSHTQGISK